MRPTHMREGQRNFDIRIQSASGAGDEFERRLHFGAIRFLGPELRRINHRFQNGANIAARFLVSAGHAIDERLRRIIRNEMAREFRGDKFRGVRIVREHFERFFAVFFAARS